MCLSFIGYEGSEQHVDGAAARRRQARQAPRRAVHRIGPGRAVRPEEVRYPVHPRLPARPRSAGRRVRDCDDVEQSDAAVRRGDRGRERRLRPRRRPGLPHVPPVAQLPRRRLPVLHVRVQGDVPGSDGTPSTRWSSPRSSRRSSTTARRSRITTRSAPSTLQWLEQDISAPGVAMLEALFDGTDPGQHLNPGKIVGTNYRAGAPVRAARAD